MDMHIQTIILVNAYSYKYCWVSASHWAKQFSHSLSPLIGQEVWKNNTRKTSIIYKYVKELLHGRMS